MFRRSLVPPVAAALVATAAPAVAPAASRDQVRDFEVTVTNVTGGQPFSPPVLATHRGQGALWRVNRSASAEVREVAENGNNTPLLNRLRRARLAGDIFDFQNVSSTGMFPGPLVPAGRPGSAAFPTTVTTRIRASRRNDRLSWVSMLVCTNDGIVGVDGIRLPKRMNRAVTIKAGAYDIRTERNTEVLGDMMPPCQGLIGVASPSGAPGVAVSDPALAERGVVIPHAGIAGGKELDPAVHGWSDPVGKITVKRVR